MFGSTVLEVVIGLVFLYLALSLICSALNEYYSALLSRRASHLRDSLFAIFNKDDPKGLAFLLEFYTHPLISGLTPAKPGVTPPTTTPTSSLSTRGLVPGLAWYQQVIVWPASLVASLASRLGGWASSALGALRWIVHAIGDPRGVGGVLSGLRTELATAAKATPTYIPDRAFSGALFAVLASDAGASRRLLVELDLQLAALAQVFRALADPETARTLTTRLEELGRSLHVTIDNVKAPEVIMDAASRAFEEFLQSLPADDPSYQPALNLVDAIGTGAVSPIAEIRKKLATDAASLPNGATKRELIRLAGRTSWFTSLRKSLEATTYQANLRADLVDREKGRKTALDRVSEALQAVQAAGPRIPTMERVRDHVLTTLESSLHRLEGAFAALPDGTSKTTLLAEIKRALDAIAAAKAGAPMTLEQVRSMATRTFAAILGAIDGLRGALADGAMVAGWVEREVAALAASEGELITISKLRDAVAALPESDIRAALLSLMDEVSDDLDKVKRNIQVWYNDSMERVSGWYKRNTQVILSIIAILIAGTLNADTIAVAQRLWTDSSLRANVNAIAKTVDPNTLTSKPVADSMKPKDPESAASDLNDAAKKILKDSGLPLGWTQVELDRVGFGDKTLASIRSFTLPPWDRSKANALIYKLLGLTLTAIAVSMGAPFWFDVLNKLVNVRTAGLQPGKTSDKPSVESTKTS